MKRVWGTSSATAAWCVLWGKKNTGVQQVKGERKCLECAGPSHLGALGDAVCMHCLREGRPRGVVGELGAAREQLVPALRAHVSPCGKAAFFLLPLRTRNAVLGS